MIGVNHISAPRIEKVPSVTFVVRDCSFNRLKCCLLHLGCHISLTAMPLLSMLHLLAIASEEEHDKRQLILRSYDRAS
jgi:hypothetical protein